MSKGKKNWEKEYEKWINGEYDSQYENLAIRYGRKAISKEEAEEKYAESQKYEDDVEKRAEIAQDSKEAYNKYKKMTAIKNNISKVKNILELKEKLLVEKESIEKELSRRENAKNLENEKELLEKENAELLLEIEEINSKLKSKDLSEDEITELENKKKENIDKRNINNDKFIENQENMKKSISTQTNELMQKDDKELEEMKISISNKVSMCNMACNNLMQGKSWEAIEVKLDNWENYKGKKGEAENMKTAVSKEEKSQESEKEKIQDNAEQNKEIKEENILPVEYKSFADRHPRLAKIPFLAKIMDKINGNNNSKNINVENQMEEISAQIGQDVEKMMNVNENEIEKDGNNKNDEFKKYLREVAEKGMDRIEKENAEKEAMEKAARLEKEAKEKAERIEKAKIKHAENKQNSANKMAEKYGGIYMQQDGAKKEDQGHEIGD